MRLTDRIILCNLSKELNRSDFFQLPWLWCVFGDQVHIVLVKGPHAWHFDRPDGLEQFTFRFPEARDNKKCNLQNGQVGIQRECQGQVQSQSEFEDQCES